jgi:hypothetical protein
MVDCARERGAHSHRACHELRCSTIARTRDFTGHCPLLATLEVLGLSTLPFGVTANPSGQQDDHRPAHRFAHPRTRRHLPGRVVGGTERTSMRPDPVPIPGAPDTSAETASSSVTSSSASPSSESPLGATLSMYARPGADGLRPHAARRGRTALEAGPSRIGSIHDWIGCDRRPIACARVAISPALSPSRLTPFAFVAQQLAHSSPLPPPTEPSPGAAGSQRHPHHQRRCGARPPSGQVSRRTV